ncbi:MAG TPA: FmdB family transcriptional regulator [Candidatus Atribacteria bacterium]|nr:FmdB family transcriptional regulator [Candidatus Atribacteria bacterium]
MPTYEYKCKKCGNTFEKFQSITEEPIRNCKTCDGEVYRLISKNGNFILKGSGFYSTDYRNNGGKSEKKSLVGSKKEEPVKKESPQNSKPEIKDKKEE